MSLLNSRIARIQDTASQRGLDAVYLRNLSNIRWASGFEGVFDTEDAHALLVLPHKVVLHSDSRYAKALKQAAENTGIEISLVRKSHFECLLSLMGLSYESHEAFGSSKSKSCAQQAASTLKIGIEDSISLRELRACEQAVSECGVDIQLVELSGFVERMREVKDEEEIRLMSRAQDITDAAFRRIVDYIKPGMSEKQIQRALDQTLFELGADGLAFSTIVASGVRGALPHSIPSDERVQVGECIVIDFGASYKGYCSDMTRTVFIGQPNEKMKRAWQTLVKANETCEASIKAGVVASDVHQCAEQILEQGGFAGSMGHSLGHSVGVDVHESPVLSPSNHAALNAGNVVTVEPGIYIEDEFGMRLEDFGVVRESGFELLTKTSHDMVIINPCSKTSEKV